MSIHRNLIVWSITLSTAFLLGCCAFWFVAAPKWFPLFVARYSPWYEQVFPLFVDGRGGDIAYSRIESEAPDHLDFLARKLTTGSDQERRHLSTMLSLSDFPPGTLREALLAALHDPVRDIRIEIAVAIASRDMKEAIPELEAAMSRAVDTDERRQIAVCIEGMGVKPMAAPSGESGHPLLELRQREMGPLR